MRAHSLKIVDDLKTQAFSRPQIMETTHQHVAVLREHGSVGAVVI